MLYYLSKYHAKLHQLQNNITIVSKENTIDLNCISIMAYK
ncbi:hypothetical protein KL86SPO_31584 [uncultured Sporomusa sp.]|uniref:Uncharacterized protein n=1 Tax=uncultured Sporomusa sp. TaxID=307249 RepID=A0A212LUV9_9FIRM|nr:hypothetical protein KL86SPO_31584 [uncultured Sporomusa sp.]